MASALATISDTFSIVGSSLKVIFDVVTAYQIEHNFQVRKASKERLPELVKAAGRSSRDHFEGENTNIN